ncbi:PREDICTED: E3 SUMO-protein ligase NSE2-like isoform X2 [Priapulus caudatus]|nr:PREDICTED: E3 SUMO-protein ligase NSE2-like isoform X2 [Priapulus caudatus]
MEMTTNATLDLLECDKDLNEETLSDLKNVMLKFVEMETELGHFRSATEHAKQAINGSNDGANLEEIFDDKFRELSSATDADALKEHKAYKDMLQKVTDMLQPGEAEEQLSENVESSDLERSGLIVTQQDVVTKCPFMLTEMTNPVQNTICKHNYDKASVVQMLEARKNVRCPMLGCDNKKNLQMADLVENSDLKRYIEKKARQTGGKRTRKHI